MLGNSTIAVVKLLGRVGPLSFSQIVERVPFAEPTIALRLKQLKRAGIIREEPAIGADGRPTKKYLLTDTGRKFLEAITRSEILFYGREVIRVEGDRVVLDISNKKIK